MRIGRQDDAPAMYRKFVAAVDDAVSSFEVNCVGKIFGAEDFRAAKALLAMRFPERYSERRILEAKVQVQQVPWIDPAKLERDELEMLRALLAKARPEPAELPRGAAPADDVLELDPGEIVEAA
jgi:hypothetical protein